MWSERCSTTDVDIVTASLAFLSTLVLSSMRLIQFCFVIFTAEFGDHDQEKHTLDFIEDFILLPEVCTCE